MTWKRGESGNPGGLSKGSRRLLTDAFIRELARDWNEHGESVIKRVREENPVAYFNGIIKLLPKEIEAEFEITKPTAVKDQLPIEAIQKRRRELEMMN